nr:hypothetical transcript [Hymenolepis microstoma]
MIASFALFCLMAIHFSDARDDFCRLPLVRGPCRGKLIVWGYVYPERKCKSFVYGGCEGNENRFLSKKKCELACGND